MTGWETLSMALGAFLGGLLFTRFFVEKEKRTFDEYGRRVIISFITVFLWHAAFG